MCFLKNRLSKLTSIFDPILVPSWPHFGTKNLPTFVQKSTPRGINKNDQFLDRFFGHLGSTLGAKLGPCWRLLGRLGSSWARLHPAQDAPRRPKIRKCRFLKPFWIVFWSIFRPNLAPTIDQNRSEIDAKMPSILDSVFGSRPRIRPRALRTPS